MSCVYTFVNLPGPWFVTLASEEGYTACRNFQVSKSDFILVSLSLFDILGLTWPRTFWSFQYAQVVVVTYHQYQGDFKYM